MSTTTTLKSMSFDYYHGQLRGKTCQWCERQPGNIASRQSLENERIKFYAHDGGYAVVGYVERQWLYVECPKCDYQWSLHKLGVIRPEESPEAKEVTA